MILRFSLLLLAACLLGNPTQASEPSELLWTPELTIQATFTENARYALFKTGETPTVVVKVEGWRHRPDTLRWSLQNDEGKVFKGGKVEVPAGFETWTHSLTVPTLEAGYYELHMDLEKAGITLPRAGSRAQGFVSFGILPSIDKLPLKWVDESRFGAQGTNFLQTGKWLQGNPFDPLYPALGLVWVYHNYRMAELEGKGPGSYVPKTDPEIIAKRNDYYAKTGLCPLIDLHGLPEWLIDQPNATKGAYAPTNNGQSYPPKDWDALGDYIRRVAQERVVMHKVLFPKMRYNYYQIHWEPDWHWKGNDADFIRMYAVAHKAIHEVDPDGKLLGPNYGVLDTGNQHLKRLFAQGLAQYMDGIATHTYYIPFGMPEPRDLPAQVRELVAMTREYLGPDAVIINTEWGTNYHGRAVDQPGVLRTEMAEFMRGHLITLGEGIDCTWYFYTADLKDDGGLMYNLTSPNPVTGALWISPKPVAMAAAASTQLLEGTTSLGPVNFIDKDIMAYLFDRAGERVLVLWSPDGVSREVSIPTGTEHITHYDIMGNPNTVESPNGLARVTVNDLPIYLRGLSPDLYATPTLAGDPIAQALPGATLPMQGISTSSCIAYRNGETITLKFDASGLHLPFGMSPGQWLVVNGANGIAAPMNGQVIEVLPELSIQQNTEAAGLTLILKNQAARTVSGQLQLRRAGDVLGTEAVTMSQNESLPLPIALTSLGKGNSSAPLEVIFIEASGAEIAGPILHTQFTNAKRAPRTPNPTNPTEGWLLEEFTSFDSENNVAVGAAEWSGKEDLMFRIAFRYDDDNLYIAIVVRDQSHVQTEEEAYMWKQDSVQIGLATLPGPDGWQSTQKLGIALNTKYGEPVITRESHNSNLRSGSLSPLTFGLSIERTGDETGYFMAIPWSEITADAKGIPESHSLGLGIFVNDADMKGSSVTPRKAMEGFGDGMGFFLPNQFGVINLGGDE